LLQPLQVVRGPAPRQIVEQRDAPTPLDEAPGTADADEAGAAGDQDVAGAGAVVGHGGGQCQPLVAAYRGLVQRNGRANGLVVEIVIPCTLVAPSPRPLPPLDPGAFVLSPCGAGLPQRPHKYGSTLCGRGALRRDPRADARSDPSRESPSRRGLSEQLLALFWQPIIV